VQGKLDLSGWNFDERGTLALDGDWEFYWNHHYSPQELDELQPRPEFIVVPGLWSNTRLGEIDLTPQGVATYRIRLHLPDTQNPLGIRMQEMPMGYQVWLNGRSVLLHRKVGPDAITSEPAPSGSLIELPAGLDYADLVMHVSGFHYRDTGFWKDVQIGPLDMMLHQRMLERLIDVFVIGAVLVIGLYNLALYVLRREDTFTLFLGLACLAVAVRSAIVGQGVLYLFFPNIPWGFAKSLEFSAFFLSVPLFLSFLAALYSYQFLKIFNRVFWCMSFPFILLVLTTPVIFFSDYLIFYQILMLPWGVVVLWTLFSELRNKNDGALIQLVAVTGILAAVLNDILYSRLLINSIPLIHVGLAVFILLQSILVAKYFSNSFARAEFAEQKVRLLNKDLIQKIQLRDIAAQKQSEAEQALAVAQKDTIRAYESSLKLKNDFIASVSHELRTPMNAIVGGLQVMQKHSSENLRSPLDIVQGGAADMMALVNDILTHTEIQSRRLTVESNDLAIYPLLKSLRLRYQRYCDDKNIVFDWQVSDELPEWIRTDQKKLRIILAKLLDNATKFTEKGQVSFFIECDQSRSPWLLSCVVKDSGIGISADARENIFDSFTQMESGFRRRYGGLGIGLSICKQLTEALGGQLNLESIEGKGSSFIVELPIRPGVASKIEKRSELLSADLPILVVEDNLVNQKVIQKLLEKLGYFSVVTSNGKEALEQLERESFSVILMDLQMPVMDGFTCTEDIRRRTDAIQTIPIIAVTANLMDADKERCIQSGMNDFLKKPVKLALLKASMEHYVEPGVTSVE